MIHDASADRKETTCAALRCRALATPDARAEETSEVHHAQAHRRPARMPRTVQAMSPALASRTPTLITGSTATATLEQSTVPLLLLGPHALLEQTTA